MSSLSCQLEQVIVNNVLVVPLEGVIEHEPFDGGRLILKFNALEVIPVVNE